MQESTYSVIVLTIVSACAILLLVLSAGTLVAINTIKYQSMATQAILATNTMQHELLFTECGNHEQRNTESGK
jgi:hypothetical protein